MKQAVILLFLLLGSLFSGDARNVLCPDAEHAPRTCGQDTDCLRPFLAEDCTVCGLSDGESVGFPRVRSEAVHSATTVRCAPSSVRLPAHRTLRHHRITMRTEAHLPHQGAHPLFFFSPHPTPHAVLRPADYYVLELRRLII